MPIVKWCPIFNCAQGNNKIWRRSPKLRARKRERRVSPVSASSCPSGTATGQQGRLREAELNQARQEIMRTQLSLRQRAETHGAKLSFREKERSGALSHPLCCRAPAGPMSYTWISTGTWPRRIPQVIVSQRTLFELRSPLHRLSRSHLAECNCAPEFHPARWARKTIGRAKMKGR